MVALGALGTALAYVTMAANAGRLGVDPTRLAVGGGEERLRQQETIIGAQRGKIEAKDEGDDGQANCLTGAVV